MFAGMRRHSRWLESVFRPLFLAGRPLRGIHWCYPWSAAPWPRLKSSIFRNRSFSPTSLRTFVTVWAGFQLVCLTAASAHPLTSAQRVVTTRGIPGLQQPLIVGKGYDYMAAEQPGESSSRVPSGAERSIRKKSGFVIQHSRYATLR